MKSLESLLERLISDGTVNNIFVRVGVNDTVVYDAKRSIENRIDSATVFDMASVTKILSTTTLAFIALDKELFTNETLVSSFFPCADQYKSLTIGHLLTHRMGIGHKPLNDPSVTIDNVAEYILNIPNDTPVGECYAYSCPAFILLGRIIEKVMGDSLDNLFDIYVAKSLGMMRTSYHPHITENMINHNPTDDLKGIVNDYNCRHLGGVTGNAGVFSCIDDMTKYAQMLLKKGYPIISTETFTNATRLHFKNDVESRALGFVYVDESFWQTGDLFKEGSIGHCGFAGQSVFVDLNSGLYVIILSDATSTVTRKFGEVRYEIVKEMRRDIHNAVKLDI